jgi:hypothetical protein
MLTASVNFAPLSDKLDAPRNFLLLSSWPSRKQLNSIELLGHEFLPSTGGEKTCLALAVH